MGNEQMEKQGVKQVDIRHLQLVDDEVQVVMIDLLESIRDIIMDYELMI